jgi:galactokinase
VHRSAEEFSRWTGRPPEEVWAAPGRVNLIGEHTDYNGGFVLPVAIDRHTVVAVGLRDDRALRCRSLQFPDDESWAVYVDAVRASLLERGIDVHGADVLVDSDVPPGAGLSSSAALEVASAAALAALTGAQMSAPELAAVAHRAETVFVGVPVGVMDQTVVATAHPGHALFLDTRSLASEHVPFDPRAHGLTLIVIDSGVRRRLGDGRYAERRRECEQAAAALGVSQLRDASLADVEAAGIDELLRRRARHVVTENARVLEVVDRLRAGDLAGIGPAVLASHASLRDDFEVSCPELDAAVDTAMAHGAVGARMTGAGFGGCALALVPDDSRAEALDAFGTAAFAVRPAGGVWRTGGMR